MEGRKTTARWQRGAVVVCGVLAFGAAELADARDIDGSRGGARPSERTGPASVAAPAPPPPVIPVTSAPAPMPGPIPSLPDGANPARPVPGPQTPIILQPSQPMPIVTPPSALTAQPLAPQPPRAATETPRPAVAAAAPSTSTGGSRITEIIPAASATTPAALRLDASLGRPPLAADVWASADPCVNVFVRSTRIDGRDVVSVDLHGDGLIKAAAPSHLAGQLLARAHPAANGAQAACVPSALAQSLFNPVVNLAAMDPAVRLVRVGDRWVLAGANAPQPTATAQAVQLAAATTTRGAKTPTKSSTKRAKPATPAPTQVARAYFP